MGKIKINESNVRAWYDAEVKRQESIGADAMSAYDTIQSAKNGKLFSTADKTRLETLLREANQIIAKYGANEIVEEKIVSPILKWYAVSEEQYDSALSFWETLDDYEKAAYDAKSMRILRGLPYYCPGQHQGYSMSFVVLNHLWRLCGMECTFLDFCRPVTNVGGIKAPWEKIKESVYKDCLFMLENYQGYTDPVFKTTFSVPEQFIEE